MAPILSISRRTRRTPFTDKNTSHGVSGYTVYNHMLLPTVFESLEADYHHLKKHVQVWDVSCQRQIEVSGPDAAELIQMLTPRNLAKMKDDQCYYLPVVDRNGGLLNDPVTVKHNENRWWISIADSDLMLWVKGLAAGKEMNVNIFEPDVWPLAVQGPKSNTLMARLFGEDIVALKFFRHRKAKFMDTEFTIARSGFSVQGGFEIYVEGAKYAEPLWDALFDAGKDLNVRAGCPNLIERIEGGLLSYGNDMTIDNTPYEAGLGRFCKGVTADSCIGADVLRLEQNSGPKQQIRGLKISGEPISSPPKPWPITVDGIRAGQVTSCAWSPDLQINIALGMVLAAHWDVGTQVTVQTDNQGELSAVLCGLPFV